MSHGDTITALPDGATVIASTDSVKNAVYSIDSLIYMLYNFILRFSYR